MSLDYSKVFMVGTEWATRDENGEVTLFATADEAAGGDPVPKPRKAKAKPVVADPAPDPDAE